VAGIAGIVGIAVGNTVRRPPKVRNAGQAMESVARVYRAHSASSRRLAALHIAAYTIARLIRARTGESRARTRLRGVTIVGDRNAERYHTKGLVNVPCWSVSDGGNCDA